MEFGQPCHRCIASSGQSASRPINKQVYKDGCGYVHRGGGRGMSGGRGQSSAMTSISRRNRPPEFVYKLWEHGPPNKNIPHARHYGSHDVRSGSRSYYDAKWRRGIWSGDRWSLIVDRNDVKCESHKYVVEREERNLDTFILRSVLSKLRMMMCICVVGLWTCVHVSIGGLLVDK